MDSKNNVSGRRMNYQMRLFLLIIIFTWILTFSFFTLQYTREREYKIETLNTELQLINNQIITKFDSKDSTSLSNAFKDILNINKNLRLSIMDTDGNVLYDSYDNGISENHKSRKEFIDALKHGTGYTVRRMSAVNNGEYYFYSATKHDDYIIRSALPYNNSLLQLLHVDTIYSWVIILIAICLSVIAYFAASRVGQSIKNLRDFADKAERGELDKYESASFPNDELGDISAHIINLYRNLERTTSERDASLKNLIFEEQEKSRIKYQLTSNINHELKTPIHAIQACIETIINNSNELDKNAIVDLADKSYSNIKRLTALIQDITTITSLTDGSARIEKTEIDIVPIIGKIKEDVSSLEQEKKIRINFDLPDKLIVNGNKGLIDAIFRNLVNNAIAYSGGRDIFLKVENETDSHIWFRFWDNGIGVAPEHLSRLFERFYRVDDGRSRKIGGTGLGLSIVKNAISFHDGAISVKNRHNGGLEFEFSLHK